MKRNPNIPITVMIPLDVVRAYDDRARVDGARRAALIRADIVAAHANRAATGAAASRVDLEEPASEVTALPNI